MFIIKTGNEAITDLLIFCWSATYRHTALSINTGEDHFNRLATAELRATLVIYADIITIYFNLLTRLVRLCIKPKSVGKGLT